MIKSAFVGIFALCAAASVQAQTYYHGDRNVIVPTSGVPRSGHYHTHYLIFVGHHQMGGHGPFAFGGFPSGYHPADIQAAYKMPSNGGTNAIAIIDAFDLPSSLADFNTFSSQFGLPTESSSNATSSSNKHFQVVYASGTQPQADQGWGGEEALDIEWAHAMAPKAKIYLVEANSNGFGDLDAAEAVAKQLLGVKECSNSWGSGEYSGETSEDGKYVQSGVAFFASAGDEGGAQSYPAESPNVVGVGGTSLQMNNGVVTSETAWSGSGGGPSSVETRPSYQSVIQSIVGSARGCPDISAVADPYTGVAVFSSFAFGGWGVVGGTSVACPVCAGITNTRGQFATSSADELQRVYKNYGSKYWRDIIGGSAGSFTAVQGWDFITGVGVPNGLYTINVNSGITPTSVSIMNGTYKSGTLSSLFKIDGDAYAVTSANVVNVGEASTIVVGFDLPQGGSSYADVLVGVTCTAPVGATTQVFAYNWVSRAYDLVQAFAGTNASASYTLKVSNLSLYESAGMQMKFAIRTFTPTRLGARTFVGVTDQTVVAPESSGQ